MVWISVIRLNALMSLERYSSQYSKESSCRCVLRPGATFSVADRSRSTIIGELSWCRGRALSARAPFMAKPSQTSYIPLMNSVLPPEISLAFLGLAFLPCNLYLKGPNQPQERENPGASGDHLRTHPSGLVVGKLVVALVQAHVGDPPDHLAVIEIRNDRPGNLPFGQMKKALLPEPLRSDALLWQQDFAHGRRSSRNC